MYHKINEILFKWHKSNIYSNGIMLKEEAMAIKEQLQNSDFDDFSASDGWLDCWKTTVCIIGEASDVKRLLPGWRG